MSNKWELEHNDQGMDDDSKKIQIDQPSASKLQSPQFLGKDLARKGTPVNDESNQPGALNLLQRFNYTMSDVDVSMKSLSEAAFVSSWNSGDTAGVQQIDIAAIDEYTINAEDNQPNNLNTIVSSDSYNAETANISKNDSSNNDHNQMGDIEVSEDGTSYWITEYNHMNYIESEVEVETTNMIKNNEVDLRESKLQDDYMILRLNDTNKVTQDIISSTQTYYVLQKFEPDQHTRIIRGDFHLCDERFNELSRGKQYVAVSVVALCFLRINENPAAWKTSDINEILINGDVQHHASYKKLKRDGKTPQKKHLLISELYPYIKIGRNYFCFTEMDKVADNYVLNLRNLEASLNRCFYENESQNGIFTCDFYSFAIIRKSHSFFLLNSRATSYAGDPMNPRDQESAACLMQVFTIKCLANHLLVACNQGHRISEDEYETDILFSLINISTEKIKFGKEVSKRQKIKRDLSISLNMTVEVDKMKPSLRGDEGKKQLEAHKVISETHSKQVKVRNGSYGCSFGFNDGNLNCENKGTFQVLIGCGMLNIVIHANKNRVPYNPSKLYQFMKSDNGDLLNGKQQDPKVFWMCIIEVMENDKNNSAMFLFGHDITTILKCECCGSSSETNVNMTGHVIEVRGRHSVQEAIDAYFTAQVVETYTCEICNTINQWKAKKKHLFKSTPKILCLTLNRLAENGIKSKDNIGLNYQLTFTDFHLSNKATHVTYKLVSTINHIGTEISKGHCTATACCSSSLFYEFDDGRVHSVDAINESDAYILIYELSTKMEYDYEMTDLSNQNQHANGVSSEPLNECEMTDLCNESQHVNGAASEQSNIEDENNAGNRLQQFQDEFDFPDDTNIQCSDNIRLSGRRIVDYSFFFEQTRILHRHEFECEDSKMELIKETKLGLRSIVFFQCSSCGKEYQIQSCFKLDDMINVNKEAALGITSIGSGFYHLEELCSHLDIPCMSSSTFDRENKKLQNDWSTLAKCHTEQALQEEIELAFARGDVDSVGNALIPVVCDGSWGKRSYGKGFSSLSGAAAIIGVNTKKIIYFDTKNKYCNICTKSYAINCPPNDHPCNINYVGPSSGMETEIIVEGFKFCEKKGARFNKMISDGDSSAFKEIREQRIYQNPELVVEKIECTNHLFKNFHKQFTKLCSNSKFKMMYRKLIKPSIGEEISKGVRMAAKHWRDSNVPMIEKLQNLEQDCLNAPYHYFGDHSNCNRYFCKKTTTEESIRIINLLKSGHVFHEILNYCNVYFASNVRSLIKDENNNFGEELNNIIAKYLGGKRINYSLAGSYTARVSAAVVQYNTKGHAGSTFHEFTSSTGNNACLKMENSRRNHYIKNEIARQIKPRKRAKTDNKKSIKGYADPQTPDLDGNAFEVAKNIEIDKLHTDQLNRDMILRKTFGQKYNLSWYEACKKLVNCSYFGRIIKSRSPKTYPKWLDDILYSNSENSNTAELCHQRIYETEALRMFSLVHKDYDLEQTGLWIDREFSFLGASPLRLYGPDCIVSVLCPVKAFNKTIDEAMAEGFLPCLKMKDGEIVINEKCHWYIEVQGQLHIAERKCALLALWLGTEFTTYTVEVDHSFWNNQMKEKLTFFFNECMIKELANPRRARKMDLRVYNPQLKTFI